MTFLPLNALLEAPPILGLDAVPGREVLTIADPFPVSHQGRLYVFVEVLGRQPAGPFKKIGVFSVSDDLARAEWLGEACPEDDGLCSFPFVVRDGDRYLLVPEVFVPMQGGGPAILQTFQVWETAAADFPFGWRKRHEGVLRGCAAPSDKVLLKDGGTWWLFCSDNAMHRLLAYLSEDLRTWRPHPANPIVSRDDAAPPRPWRLGGTPLLVDGDPALPLQHGWAGETYGGAVTLLKLIERTPERIRTRFDATPLLAADPRRAWMSRGAHHVAVTEHSGRCVVATDGFDGTHWRSTLVEAPPTPSLRPHA
ncbi:MAG TPA: hypothetical protein VFC25_08270 [Verrucomicrobiae bacterium]|nr:hypothetical protein [Verrucomicrobiae bacterium]